jgi:hypothetical protein
MDDIKIPSLIEYYKTKSLIGGRVETSLHLFMIDSEVFENICMNFLRGQSNIVECRVGSTIKHPKDKYDKTIAKQEVYKKLKKQKFEILSIQATEKRSCISLKNGMFIIMKDSRIIVNGL